MNFAIGLIFKAYKINALYSSLLIFILKPCNIYSMSLCEFQIKSPKS